MPLFHGVLSFAIPLPETNPSHLVLSPGIFCIIVLDPRKLLLELIASRDGFSLGTVILPSSVAWVEISIGPCGFEFMVAVSVT